METTRVLLVDDDEDCLEVNRIVLEASGFEVVTATGSEQAMRIATTVPLGAAVLDVMMSTPDEGFTLARDLRRNPSTRAIPLVMLTSVNAVNASQGSGFRFSDQDRDETWLPVDKFLDKPVKPGVLVALLRALTA
jgi:CheY-like chemotaxis protein